MHVERADLHLRRTALHGLGLINDALWILILLIVLTWLFKCGWRHLLLLWVNFVRLGVGAADCLLLEVVAV